MSIYPYQTREVRDLAWACFSPPLLITDKLEGPRVGAANCAFPMTADRRAWLETLDRDATPLLDHLATVRTRRLGIYFESLWQFFLSQDAEVDLLACNLPVQDHTRTLGEFDILYFCRRRNCHVHLELAVKFYLGWRQGDRPCAYSTPADWLGPNPRDRLDIKIDHLLEHQIQLGGTAAARPLLDCLGIDQLTREIEIKGYLFGPASATVPPPKAFDHRQAIHHWLRLGDLLDTPLLESGDSYHILPRMQWLSPAQASSGERLSTREGLFATLREEMARVPHPRLVAALDARGCEVQRFFVTGADWPSR